MSTAAISRYQKYLVADTIPEGTSGDWQVRRFTVTPEDERVSRLRAVISSSSRGRWVPAGTYTGLYHNGEVIMSDTPDEIRDHYDPIFMARGRCLVNGLGLGVVVNAMLQRPGVDHVTVVEIAPEVIDLVGRHWQAKYRDQLEIIQADAFTWKPPRGSRYDVVWHDIWPNLSADNLEEMRELHRKYARRCKWQGSWGREICEMDRRAG
jgi:hypothetical protein